MGESFDGVFQKKIDFSNGLSMIVVYNPYLDRWEFHFMGKMFIFDELCGKKVYQLLSSMKWMDEDESESAT